MSDLKRLTCPACGAKLIASNDSTLFICAFCGKKFSDRRSGSIAVKKSVEEKDRKINNGVEKRGVELDNR
jgi:uncharacterized Zn finger protein (UPF0148 family)